MPHTRSSVIALWLSAGCSPAFASTNVQWLHGRSPVATPADRSTFTVEYFERWTAGDQYFFVDVLQPVGEGTTVYAEWAPRLSLSHLVGKPRASGTVREVFLAGQLNAGEDFNAQLYGAAVDWALPGFAVWSTQLYLRDERGQRGHTAQLTQVWLSEFGVLGTRWQFTGFLDWAGAEGASRANVQTQPQLLLDTGALWGRPGTVLVGAEYLYWHNAFGVAGLTERLPQLLIKVEF